MISITYTSSQCHHADAPEGKQYTSHTITQPVTFDQSVCSPNLWSLLGLREEYRPVPRDANEEEDAASDDDLSDDPPDDHPPDDKAPSDFGIKATTVSSSRNTTEDGALPISSGRVSPVKKSALTPTSSSSASSKTSDPRVRPSTEVASIQRTISEPVALPYIPMPNASPASPGSYYFTEGSQESTDSDAALHVTVVERLRAQKERVKAQENRERAAKDAATAKRKSKHLTPLNASLLTCLCSKFGSHQRQED